MSDYPSRLWHASAIRQGNDLVVNVAWDHVSSGYCMIREVVRYSRRDPIFDWNPPNPSINRPYVPASIGHAPDRHSMPSVRRPRMPGKWIAEQQYEWSLDQISWQPLGQVYVIEREVRKADLGKNWIYRLTKRGLFAEGNGRRFYHFFEAELPG